MQETDKATIDVETQEDGVLGKILVRLPYALPSLTSHDRPADRLLDCPSAALEQKQDGAKGIQVGELIGILVEEGDDTASLSADQFSAQEGSDAPAESSSSSSSSSEKPAEASSSSASSSSSSAPKESEPAPAAPSSHGGHTQYTHSKPLAPSVSRLLSTSSLAPEVVAKLKGSGRAGYLTKGDVLKAMGKVPTVWGSKESEALEQAGKRGVMERFAVRPANRYQVASPLNKTPC